MEAPLSPSKEAVIVIPAARAQPLRRGRRGRSRAPASSSFENCIITRHLISILVVSTCLTSLVFLNSTWRSSSLIFLNESASVLVDQIAADVQREIVSSIQARADAVALLATAELDDASLPIVLSLYNLSTLFYVEAGGRFVGLFSNFTNITSESRAERDVTSSRWFLNAGTWSSSEPIQLELAGGEKGFTISSTVPSKHDDRYIGKVYAADVSISSLQNTLKARILQWPQLPLQAFLFTTNNTIIASTPALPSSSTQPHLMSRSAIVSMAGGLVLQFGVVVDTGSIVLDPIATLTTLTAFLSLFALISALVAAVSRRRSSSKLPLYLLSSLTCIVLLCSIWYIWHRRTSSLIRTNAANTAKVVLSNLEHETLSYLRPAHVLSTIIGSTLKNATHHANERVQALREQIETRRNVSMFADVLEAMPSSSSLASVVVEIDGDDYAMIGARTFPSSSAPTTASSSLKVLLRSNSTNFCTVGLSRDDRSLTSNRTLNYSTLVSLGDCGVRRKEKEDEQAAKQEKESWTDLQVFKEGGFGTTFTSLITDDDGEIIGRIKVDVRLDSLSDRLQLDRQTVFPATQRSQDPLPVDDAAGDDADDDGIVVSVVDQGRQGDRIRSSWKGGALIGASHGTSVVRHQHFSTFINAGESDHEFVASVAHLMYDLSFPLVRSFKWIERALDEPFTFVDSIAVDEPGLHWFGTVSIAQTSFLSAISTRTSMSFVLIGFMITVFWMISQTTPVDPTKTPLLNTVNNSGHALLGRLRALLKEATAGCIKDGDADEQAEAVDDEKRKIERAVVYMNDGSRYRSVFRVCYLERRQNWIVLALYRAHTSRSWSQALNTVLVIHTALDYNFSGRFLVLELLCIAFECVHVAVGLVVKHCGHADDDSYDTFIDVCQVTVMLMLVIEVCVLRHVASGSFSIEQLIPLRPWMLVLVCDAVRSGAQTFVKSLARSGSVLLLYTFLVLISSAIGAVLFSDHSVEYSTFFTSLITTFVFVSTGENYADVVYQAAQRSPAYIAYFVAVSTTGMFFALAIVIAMFQDGFQHNQSLVRRQRRIRRRQGIVAAFHLLSRHDLVSQRSLKTLLHRLNSPPPVPGSAAAATSLDMTSFVTVMERVLRRRRARSSWWIPRSSLGRYLASSSVISSCAPAVVTCTLVAHMIMVCLFASEVLLSVSMLLLALDTVIRALISSSSDARAALGAEGRFALRFDMYVMGISCVGWLLAPSNRRLFMSLALLRILTAVSSTNHLLYTLATTLPSFVGLFVLLLVVLDTFAQVGVSWFGGRFSAVLPAEQRPPGTFDTLASASLALFQLVVGEGWHHFMYAAMRTNGVAAAAYFVGFIFLVTILFANLFVGVILSLFSQKHRHHRSIH